MVFRSKVKEELYKWKHKKEHYYLKSILNVYLLNTERHI